MLDATTRVVVPVQVVATEQGETEARRILVDLTWLKRLIWGCEHEQHIPVLPYVGARQIKVCEHCGRWEKLGAYEDRDLPKKAW